jgi:transposase
MEVTNQRHGGIDVGKKTMEVRIIDNGKIKNWNGKTDEKGRKALTKILRKTDRIGIEAGMPAFLIAKQIIKEVGCEVVVLNPGDLQIIYKSLKKTDKEDALKLARMVEKYSNEELPVVALPTEEEERNRALVSQMVFYKEERNRLINRLHSVYVRAGIVDLSKKDLKAAEGRARCMELISEERFIKEVKMLERSIVVTEENIAEIEEKKTEALSKNENSQYLLSIPGVGPELALAFLAYVGDGSRFSKAPQVSNYVGLVPKVDISGDTERYGHITKRGCTQIRRVAIQAAWALVRSKWGGDLQRKFGELVARKSKGVAIVAIARKLIELMWTVITRKSYYWYMPEENRNAKMKMYKIRIMAA